MGFSCWEGSVVMYNPKQGDIVFLDFSPQSGHEQAGRRPGVVISNDQFFMRTKFAVVCGENAGRFVREDIGICKSVFLSETSHLNRQ